MKLFLLRSLFGCVKYYILATALTLAGLKGYDFWLPWLAFFIADIVELNLFSRMQINKIEGKKVNG